MIGTGAASGGCHDTTACALPGVAVPMVGGGSATHADKPNATNATTTTAIANRSGLTDRVIASPPSPVLAPYSMTKAHRRPLQTTALGMPSAACAIWRYTYRSPVGLCHNVLATAA